MITTILDNLFNSLDQRLMPEEVAKMLLAFGELPLSVRKVVKTVAAQHRYSSMSSDFFRGVPSSRKQLDLTRHYLGVNPPTEDRDTVAVLSFLNEIEKRIGKTVGRNDYKHDRLNREQRRAAGITLKHRQYNKLFRIMSKIEDKTARLDRANAKRSLTLASKSRLASKLSREMFASDTLTACFLAYFVARANLRSMFTVNSQTRAFDTVCEAMMKHLRTSRTTNWFAIAHVMPDHEIIKRLSDEQKGQLMGQYYEMLIQAGKFLDELWQNMSTQQHPLDRKTMIVQRGHDSSTWNLAAGAWNKLRDGWFALCFEMNAIEILETQCFGKVMRLMAADVAAWHRMSGEVKHEDTDVWATLPLPWKVLAGEEICSRQYVQKICKDLDIDPMEKGWIARLGKKKVEKFAPTPELVHGVTVSCPVLAKIMRKAGIFSGKEVKLEKADTNLNELLIEVDNARTTHYLTEEEKKAGERKN